ncbi:hypothetical protein NE237_017399 [Protea cynaroides]|uniref:Uncharacterized protein n=1 Tax=Protea cynaroides TaxID=273540 RepID=A0A9Q0QMY5_9MAGN|nr:hypothetical protein NE237_017399 [Protea cynaroides]
MWVRGWTERPFSGAPVMRRWKTLVTSAASWSRKTLSFWWLKPARGNPKKPTMPRLLQWRRWWPNAQAFAMSCRRLRIRLRGPRELHKEEVIAEYHSSKQYTQALKDAASGYFKKGALYLQSCLEEQVVVADYSVYMSFADEIENLGGSSTEE